MCAWAFGLLAVRPAAAAESGAVFAPHAKLTLGGLIQLIHERSPTLQEELIAVDAAQADVRQSRLWENPTLDAAVGTLPIGETNPSDLASPLTSIPNYAVGLSYRPDVARRRSRQARATAGLNAARAQLRFSVRDRALSLARVLGELASASLRIEATRGLLEQARSALGMAGSRVSSGYSAPLEADRAEIDVFRLEEKIHAGQGELMTELARCAELIGARCLPFESSGEARAFLVAWFPYAEQPLVDIERRADLQALSAQRDAAAAEKNLAAAQAVPDPTVRLGYLYDSFVVSGNQRHSLNVSLSLPLPIFDHGQSGAQAAAARMLHLETERRRRLLAAQAHIEALQSAFQSQRKRREVLQTQMLPRAQAMLINLTRAFELRTLRLTELVQARTILDDLLLAEADSLHDSYLTAIEILEQLPDDNPTR